MAQKKKLGIKVELIANMLKEGGSVISIAAKLGCSRQNIYQVLAARKCRIKNGKIFKK